MITLNTATDILIQIHRLHIRKPLPISVTLRFTDMSKKSVTVPATVQTLTNCYILSIADGFDLRTLGLNAGLEIVMDDEVVYTTPAQLYLPASTLIAQ